MISPIQTPVMEELTDIGQRVVEILRRNDLGTWTKPAPNL
jgi:hypothetical protein